MKFKPENKSSVDEANILLNTEIIGSQNSTLFTCWEAMMRLKMMNAAYLYGFSPLYIFSLLFSKMRIELNNWAVI